MENYNIITLGASGAGKTVFLASLFKRFSISGDEGIYLEVPNGQQKKLNQIYTQVARMKSWPQGTTKQVTEWCFTCFVKTQNLDKYPVCQFTYIDYAGGLLTEPDEDEEESEFEYDFREKISHADAIIVLIDGLQLLKFLEADFDYEDPGVEKWLFSDLPGTLILLNQSKKDTPVHFVVTKWDLLEEDYFLSNVRKCLQKSSEEFNKIVNMRVRANCPVRLIPISSVGQEFVTMQSNGSMKKNLPNIPKPFQLEIPLSYVLIDRARAAYNKIQKEGQRIEKSRDYKLSFIWNLIPKFFKRDTILTHEERMQRLKNVNDAKSAFNYLIDYCVSNIREFEEDFPYADLGGSIKLSSVKSSEEETQS